MILMSVLCKTLKLPVRATRVMAAGHTGARQALVNLEHLSVVGRDCHDGSERQGLHQTITVNPRRNSAVISVTGSVIGADPASLASTIPRFPPPIDRISPVVR